MADTLHITFLDTSGQTSVAGQSHDHGESSHNHGETDDCHTGHFHHFLQSAIIFELSLSEFQLTFPELQISFRNPFLEIIKPPLLIA